MWYKNRSIKSGEHSLRGDSYRFVIRSGGVRIPADFETFLTNGDSKERMFEVIEEVWQENSEKLGNTSFNLQEEVPAQWLLGPPQWTLRFSNRSRRSRYKDSLMQHAANTNHDKDIMCVVRSNSGDIDIPIILLGIELERNVHVYIDNGTGKNRRVSLLNKCNLTDHQRQALVGVHVFTGNDYVASFLRKRKQLCWRQVCKDEEFLDLFAMLDTEINVTQAMYIGSEKYVCRLCGERRVKEVNEGRSTIFWEKIKKENKLTDISLLPPW